MRRYSLFVALFFLTTPLLAQSTVAERTQATKTSSHADVLTFLDSLADRGAGIRVGTLGTSAQGRRIPYVVAARPMVSDPGEAHRSGKPIVYIQANIHAGEVEGKEAMLQILRDLSFGSLRPLLDSVIVLAVPIYNTDGNDAFGPATRNRPGQNGPDTVGLRSNGQGYDLNRDYIKQDAPETRASLAFVREWDPDVWMDLHTTNGSYHGYNLTYSPGLNPNSTVANAWVQDTVLVQIRSLLRKKGVQIFPYGNFEDQTPDSLNKGWVTYESVPRFGSNLMGMNRISILSEAYSNDPFAKRITSTYAFVVESLRWLAQHRAEVKSHMARTVLARADSVKVRSAFAPPRMDTVVAEITLASGEGRGGFSRRQRTGEFRSVYMPVIDRFVGTRSEKIPAAYVLGPEWNEVIPAIRNQGIVVEQLDDAWSGVSQKFRLDSVTVGRMYEGHRMVTVQGEWGDATPDSLPRGSFLISTDQRQRLVAAFILEPASEDGLTTWNYFDRALRARGVHPVRRLDRLPMVPRTIVP